MTTTTMPTTISASRIGPMLGVSPWQTPLQLYMELRGELQPKEDNAVLEEGREFEQAIFNIGCRKFGYSVYRDAGEELTRGNLIGHPDRVAIDRSAGLVVAEIKHTLFGAEGDEKWGEAGTDQLPEHYKLQLMAYQWMLRDKPGTIADHGVLFARLVAGVTRYVVKVDDEKMHEINALAGEFLERVREGRPPDPINEADCRMRWLAQPGKRHQADEEMRQWLHELGSLTAARLSAEKREKELKKVILLAVEDASEIVDIDDRFVPRVLATVNANRVFDGKGFAAAHPDIVREFQYQEVDWSTLRKKHAGLAESFMRSPLDWKEQTRVLRLKGDK